MAFFGWKERWTPRNGYNFDESLLISNLTFAARDPTQRLSPAPYSTLFAQTLMHSALSRPNCYPKAVSKAGLVSLFAAALAVRLILIATSFGSTDALLLMAYTHLAERHGIGPAYQYAPYLNHPPLSGAIMNAADRLGSAVGLEFSDAFRLLQTLADCATAALLCRLGKSKEAAAFFFVSPAAIFLSGFHCTADPTMMALLVASVWTTSGALFGLASGIKIAPLPLAPFFLISLDWRRRILFVLTSLTALVLIFVPAVLTGGTAVLRNVFQYPGSGYEWGFCGLGFLTHSRAWAELYAHYGRYIVIVALACLFVFYWKRPKPPATMIAVALSVFLFATYTIWAREFPWWFANAAAPDVNRRLIALLAVPLWALYGVAIVVALRGQPSGQLAPEQLAEG
ncbi:MAG TPA: glycosyltransferase family 87 protein [Thermoanaerobaculia bacterium]|nr:glycosyltransferase family 87 protein [Thermoanaerobaculia bacterium]